MKYHFPLFFLSVQEGFFPFSHQIHPHTCQSSIRSLNFFIEEIKTLLPTDITVQHPNSLWFQRKFKLIYAFQWWGYLCLSSWFMNCDFNNNPSINCLAGQAPVKSKSKSRVPCDWNSTLLKGVLVNLLKYSSPQCSFKLQWERATTDFIFLEISILTHFNMTYDLFFC